MHWGSEVPLVIAVLVARSISQFTCIVGGICTLPVFDFGIPNTPLIRVSEVVCGNSSAGSLIQVVSSPLPNMNLGVIPSIFDSVSVLHVCYSPDSHIVNDSFAGDWGSVDIVGPTVGGEWVCYFGSPCWVSISGNKLSSVPSVIFFSDSGSCNSGPSPDFAFNLENEQAIWSISTSDDSPLFHYKSFGVVDPSLDSMVSYVLCWSSIPGGGSSESAAPIGNLKIAGPLIRNSSLICYLGEPCSFHAPYPEMDEPYWNQSILAISSTSDCNGLMEPVSWPSFNSPFGPYFLPNSSENGEISFGIPSGVNNMSVESNALCWGLNQQPRPGDASPDDSLPLVKIGTFSMIGPTHLSMSNNCIYGILCEVTLLGLFDETIIFPSNHCTLKVIEGGDTDCSIDSFSDESTIVSITSSKITFSLGVFVSGTYFGLCWLHNVYVGKVEMFGPISLFPETLECVVGSRQPCDIDLPITLPTAIYPFLPILSQRLTLLVAEKSVSNPCAEEESSGVVVAGTAEGGVFDVSKNSTYFQLSSPITYAHSSVFNYTLCWEISGEIFPLTRAIGIGSWSPIGPQSGINQTCFLGELCNVSIPTTDENLEAASSGVFLMSPDFSCSRMNSRFASNSSIVPVLRGDDDVSNPAASAVTVLWDVISSQWMLFISFGRIFGFTSPQLGRNVSNSFTLCYSAANDFKFSTNLGSLTFSTFVSLRNETYCELGSICTIELLFADPPQSPPASNYLFLAAASDECDPTYSASDITQPVFGDTFQTTIVPSSGPIWNDIISNGRAAVCYLVPPRATFLAGYIGISGTFLFSEGGLTSSSCVKGNTNCSIPLQYLYPVNPTALITLGDPSCSALTEISWSVSSNILSVFHSHHSLNDTTVCYSSNNTVSAIPIGTVRFEGPFETNSVTCLVGSPCSFSLNGTFHEFGEVSIMQPHNVSLPCASSAPSPFPGIQSVDGIAGGELDPSSSIFIDLGVLNVTADIPVLSICWRAKGMGESFYVFSGTLTLIGPQSSLNFSCNVSSTKPCELWVPLVGGEELLTPLMTSSRAVLVNGNNCNNYSLSSNLNLAHIKIQGDRMVKPRSSEPPSNQVFSFGPIHSWNSQNIGLCWSPNGTQHPSVFIGLVSLERPLCDPLYVVAQQTSMSVGISSSSPEFLCDVIYSPPYGGRGVKRYSLVLFTILELGRLSSFSFLNVLFSKASRNALWMSEVDTYVGRSVLAHAVDQPILSDDWIIASILEYGDGTQMFTVADLMAVIYAQRDSVCVSLIERLPAESALQEALEPARLMRLVKCLVAIQGRLSKKYNSF